MTASSPTASIFQDHPAVLAQELSRHNKDWDSRLQNALRYLPPPLWNRDLILSPEKNARTDSFLPWDDLSASLRRLGRVFFKDSSHIPLLLHSCRDLCSLMQKNYSLQSVLEFWQLLPDFLAGRLHYAEKDLLPLFCALADPARFGTAAQRYPEQLEQFRELLGKRHSGALQILDLGCGIGLGTLEIAETVRASGLEAEICGVTIEPLEVWMATSRRLPHCPERENEFQKFSQTLPCRFLTGNAETYADGRQYDFIFCNGLAGGRFLDSPDALNRFLTHLEALLKPTGIFLAANHFHEGFLPGVERLMQLAGAMNFSVSGNSRNLTLARKTAHSGGRMP